MKRYDEKGAITVFLSLVGVLFLSLICTAVESARVQGCRAKAAAALDMGLFSAMGEYERELLDHYDVFFLDGAAGSGSYRSDQLNATLHQYMEYNVQPNKGQLIKGFDPFPLELNDAAITGVGLATDNKGAAFYQQAVGFMRENLATEVISTWMERVQEGEQLEQAGEIYKQRDQNISDKLQELEKQQEELEQQKQLEQQDNGGQERTVETEQSPEIPASRNPIEIIKKLKKEGILGLVLKDRSSVSQKELPSGSPSKRSCLKGNLSVKKKYGGAVDDLIFQEYLFERFPLYTDTEKEGVLDYGLEYILCGKNSDEKNLKSVVNRLLLLREGANFAYLSGDPASMGTAEAMAAALVGIIPVPGLITATAYALLLVWAYGESLLDVRELLAGGRVPVQKTAATFKLGLSSVPDILGILEHTDGTSQEGLAYADYLQILFTLASKKNYSIRALDLVEGYMRSRPETSAFRIDYAVFKIEAEANYTIPPLFLKISNAFLKTGVIATNYHVSGSFAY